MHSDDKEKTQKVIIVKYMTQSGFEEYLFATFSRKNGTAKSHITAIHIVDEMLSRDDVFSLHGKSITCVEDQNLLKQIVKYIRSQQNLFIKGEDSIFRDVNPNQVSYPQKCFCSAAAKQLLKYSDYDREEKHADSIVMHSGKGTEVSKQLITFFHIDKEGKDDVVETKRRIGQNYFRKMVLANYNNKCCVTGLDVPQTLRASHIVSWADDKSNRMNPENGLCLSATYDAAFDNHLISFDEDYRMIISKVIKEFFTNEVTRDYFEKFEGVKINLPLLYKPSKKLMAKHRELMID